MNHLRPASTGLVRGATLPEPVRPLGLFAQVECLIASMASLEQALKALQRSYALPSDTQQFN